MIEDLNYKGKRRGDGDEAEGETLGARRWRGSGRPMSYQQLGQTQAEELDSVKSKPATLNAVLLGDYVLRLRLVTHFDCGVIFDADENSERPSDNAAQAADEQKADEQSEELPHGSATFRGDEAKPYKQPSGQDAGGTKRGDDRAVRSIKLEQKGGKRQLSC